MSLNPPQVPTAPWQVSQPHRYTLHDPNASPYYNDLFLPSFATMRLLFTPILQLLHMNPPIPDTLPSASILSF